MYVCMKVTRVALLLKICILAGFVGMSLNASKCTKKMLKSSKIAFLCVPAQYHGARVVG